MTTPKGYEQKKRLTSDPPPPPSKPNFPELQGLPEEFRRLAALAQRASESFIRDNDYWRGTQKAYATAAQMLEEKLNG